MPDGYVPKAARSMRVEISKARFTVLTDRMVRMEWAADGVFEDRPTLAVVNRRMPKVPFSLKKTGKRLTLATARLTLRYLDDGRPFSAANLNVTFVLNGRAVRWHPGKADARNLKGTCRTLDKVRGARTKLGEGLISRSGWAVFDDSRSVVLDSSQDGRPWPTPRPKGRRQDLYLLAYGHDYKAALHDAAMIFGRQPLPPRFTLGYWWSRYWAYTDKEIESLVCQHDAHGIALDVIVLDMDWHLGGWTGYTWDRRHFPDPDEFLRWLKRRGLKVTLNLHPAKGVGKHEEQFTEMAKALKRNPRATGKIEFDCTNPSYMDAYFKLLHHPMEDQGVDFWWIDWQQGRKTKVRGLDPLPWLNQLHWQDAAARRPQRRPLILSRFGGLGSGRHPVGFSGDSYSVWESLAFQPYFTATAANVLFGYWSHDIGGHMPGKIAPELYTRWIQFGVFSPILRTHATKNVAAERRVWAYPSPYCRIMADAIRLRYEMVPYIYTECRKSMETGLSLCRPTYHEWPKDARAYQGRDQYLFGDEMLVAPVVRPVSAKDEMAEVKIFLPPGEWFDTALGSLETGGQIIRRKYLTSEIPVFVKAGAIIPGQRPPKRLSEGAYPDLIVTVYPGRAGRYELYEDDGISQDYLRGRCATILLSHQSSKGKRTITISKANGRYKGFTSKRTLEVRLPGSPPPEGVKVSRKRYPWTHRPQADSWSYDGQNATVVIRISSLDLTGDTRIEVTGSPGVSTKAAMGLKGVLGRLDRVREYATSLGWILPLHPKERLAVEAAQMGNRISRDPGRFAAEIRRLPGYLRELPGVLSASKRLTRRKKLAPNAEKARRIIASAQRLWRRSRS